MCGSAIYGGELEQGRSKEKAKEIAAATVVKHHNENDHDSGR